MRIECTATPIRVIKRSDIKDVFFKKMLKTESHHDHKIISIAGGEPEWEAFDETRKYLENISLNDLCPLFYSLGFDKNSEAYRKLYRNMGYSLFGYWEIFYWEVNNPDAKNYKQPKIKN